MVKGLHVPADSAKSISEQEFNRLEDYQAGVGGYIEHVDIPLLKITLVVSEEGRLRGLDFNSRATFLWWYHVIEARQQAMLVGDVVIVGWPDRSGEATNVPDELVALFTRGGLFAIEIQRPPGAEWVDRGPVYEDYFEALVWGMVLAERLAPCELRIVGRVSEPS
jgi:hypothetical protein